MEDFLISGIQQIGVGTVNFRKSWNWFIEMFGVDVKILEDDTVAERMLPYTGHHPQKRHACIAMNMQGGGGFEIWQYSERTCPNLRASRLLSSVRMPFRYPTCLTVARKRN